MNARIVPLGLAAALWAGAAFAHHGWGSYEVSKIFKISASRRDAGMGESPRASHAET